MFENSSWDPNLQLNISCPINLNNIELDIFDHEQQSETEFHLDVPNTFGQTSYQCPSCGKKYGYKGNLTRHMKVECGKEPTMECPYCQLKCKHKRNLEVHILRKHKNKVDVLNGLESQ